MDQPIEKREVEACLKGNVTGIMRMRCDCKVCTGIKEKAREELERDQVTIQDDGVVGEHDAAQAGAR